MINSPSNTSKCFNCGKAVKAKKLSPCQDCNELYCKNHIKFNDEECSSLCFPCLKKRVHLEISMEMEKEILEHKTELRLARTKLKSVSQELKDLEETTDSFKSKATNTENIHKVLVKELEVKLKNVIARVDWDDYTSTMKKLESERAKNSHEKSKLMSLENDFKAVSKEKEKITKDIQEYEMVIKKMHEKIPETILYSIIRTVFCNPCKRIVKKKFTEDISKGYPEDRSVMASIRPRNSTISIRNTTLRTNKNESCNCLII